ncbi:MAG TPA: tetratricopeptide repeat protein [Gemmatimonadales bacterium]|nr:tetratricopeptide repeat protein [Gemmatimonadales bacterium]
MSITQRQGPGGQDLALLLQNADQLLQAGRLDEAESLCRQVLEIVPNHAEALFLSGVVAERRGRNWEALELIDRALIRSPRFVDAHNHRGDVMRALGRPDEALGSYRHAITIAPGKPLGWSNLGNALQDLGRPDEAMRSYLEAIARDADFGEAHLNLGIVLRQLGRVDEALASFEAAIRVRPDYPPAHENLGNALRDLGRVDEAIESYRRAVALDPGFTRAFCNLGAALWQAGRFAEAAEALHVALDRDPHSAEAHNHLGNVCKSLGYLDQAVSAYRQALAERPDYAEAHFNLGALLGDLERPLEALAAYRTALGFKPDFAEAHASLGATLMKLDRPTEAVTAYRRALELKPDLARSWYDLGSALQEESRLAEAVAAFDRAIRLRPDHPEAHWKRGLALLGSGQFDEGWTEYEWRWKVGELGLAQREFGVPRWDGTPLGGRTILVHAERGLSDALQFVRYLPLVAQREGRIVLECQSPLTRLLEALPAVAQVIPRGGPLPPADCEAPLQSLPLILGSTPSGIPDATPYLPTQIWSGRIPRLPPGEGLRVGVVWGGSPRPNPRRSMPLAILAPLFGLPGVTWYSLQVGEPGAQLLQVPQAAGVRNLAPLIRDFADTAALVGQLDLVLTVDTSVAHLAGGLGARVWVMLTFAPDWRWSSDADKSPWYPTARLFRQPRPGDWPGVVAQVRRALSSLVLAGGELP